MLTDFGNSNRIVTTAELRAHGGYASAWIAINGVVYDITRFIPKHPFGDTFRGHLGTECGGLFSSAHTATRVEALLADDAFRKRHEIALVGRLDLADGRLDGTGGHPYLERLGYRDTAADAFWLELKGRVATYLKEQGETTHYSNTVGALYLIYYLSIYVLLSWLTWVQGSFLAAVLLGFHMICALASIAHMATHAGFTRHPRLDFIAMHLFDLSGMSALEWQITHQTHHHQPHSSADYQTNAYGRIGIRIHRNMPHRRLHRFQHVYFWLVVSAYLLFKGVSTSWWLIRNREFVRHRREFVAHVAAKGLLLALIALCAVLHGLATALALFAIYCVAYSQTAFLLLFNDHEETHAPLGDQQDLACLHGKPSWAEVQVRTSGNWYPTNWLLAFVEFHYGYFNYHIEHHLFPTFKPSLLKRISPIVRRVCRAHGVPYICTPFFDVQQSLARHLYAMGTAPRASGRGSQGHL